MYFQALQMVGGTETRDHALDDFSDGGPGNSHGLAHRRLVHHLSQVGDLVFEVAREARPGLGPGHQLDAHPAALTVTRRWS